MILLEPYTAHLILDQFQNGRSMDNESSLTVRRLKDSSGKSHFIFEINVGKSRIRDKTLKLNDDFLHRLKINKNRRHSI